MPKYYFLRCGNCNKITKQEVTDIFKPKDKQNFEKLIVNERLNLYQRLIKEKHPNIISNIFAEYENKIYDFIKSKSIGQIIKCLECEDELELNKKSPRVNAFKFLSDN
jgi:hypothetical protein